MQVYRRARLGVARALFEGCHLVRLGRGRRRHRVGKLVVHLSVDEFEEARREADW